MTTGSGSENRRGKKYRNIGWTRRANIHGHAKLCERRGNLHLRSHEQTHGIGGITYFRPRRVSPGVTAGGRGDSRMLRTALVVHRHLRLALRGREPVHNRHRQRKNRQHQHANAPDPHHDAIIAPGRRTARSVRNFALCEKLEESSSSCWAAHAARPNQAKFTDFTAAYARF